MKSKTNMKITSVRAIPMSDPIPEERQHRTDLGTKIKSDSAIIQVETDDGLIEVHRPSVPLWTMSLRLRC